MAKALTWGADEHILCALAAGWWLLARNKSPEQRLASDHVLLTTLVASALPHLLKTIFDQERPDRLTVRGHWRGIPFSGNRLDAFPSGHAVHTGALASAASILPAKQRNAAWGIGLGLVLTRIILLAHWSSDVVVGLGVGVLTERIIRCFTGSGFGCTSESGSTCLAVGFLPSASSPIGDRIIEPMIALAGCSKQHRIVVAGSKAVELMYDRFAP